MTVYLWQIFAIIFDPMYILSRYIVPLTLKQKTETRTHTLPASALLEPIPGKDKHATLESENWGEPGASIIYPYTSLLGFVDLWTQLPEIDFICCHEEILLAENEFL
eukprot:Blabericola_migrator_1__8839@NODE_4672_length_1027_cov_322_688542_g2907_i0_p1_GENE_NODE_4672_length_1027_cov_322_688542_g2907_i0NODE_4672_length_1027_cov_322_688542_g2907_i0_p1_ORF_typecomplete_len107_score6_45_NODE_4672_length_1027_cov_322_688542_g2907_i0497817